MVNFYLKLIFFVGDILGFYFGYVAADDQVDESIFGYGCKFLAANYIKQGSVGLQINSQLKPSDRKHGNIVLFVNQ